MEIRGARPIKNAPTVVFIDDGIHPAVVPPGIPFESRTADASGVHPSPPARAESHGTLCYRIFNSRVHVPYRLISLQVLDAATGAGSRNALFAALDWCAEQPIDLINMSLGTRQYIDFSPIITRVRRLRGPVIVAACANQNELTLPACLPQVIGVRHTAHEALRGGFAYLRTPFDGIDILAHVHDTLPPANSCAAPLISARVCAYLAAGIQGTENIRRQLIADAAQNTAFADYPFYKSLLRKWEEADIPTVLITGNDIPRAGAKMAELLRHFVSDGYQAIGLSQYIEAPEVENLIFPLAWRGAGDADVAQLITLYYNFARPDILFLHMDATTALPENSKPETVVAESGDFTVHDTARALFEKIKTALQ